MLKDLIYQSKFFQVPLTIPEKFPVNTLKAQRVLVAIKMQESQELLIKLSKAFYISLFQKKMEINELEVLKSIMMDVTKDSGLTDKYLSLSETKEVKNELTEITNNAYENGAFGNSFNLFFQPTNFLFQISKVHHFFSSNKKMKMISAFLDLIELNLFSIFLEKSIMVEFFFFFFIFYYFKSKTNRPQSQFKSKSLIPKLTKPSSHFQNHISFFFF